MEGKVAGREDKGGKKNKRQKGTNGEAKKKKGECQ